MDLNTPISELRRQLDEIDQAINALERLQTPGQVKRGRPPKSLAEAQTAKPTVNRLVRHAASSARQ